MPSPMKFYKRDPNGKGRGQGFYYNRGGYKRGWKSKYSGSQDGVYRPRKNTKNLKGRYEHTGDRNRNKRTRHKIPVSPRKSRIFKGFF